MHIMVIQLLGYQRPKPKKSWITEETLSLIDEKRLARQSDLKKYKELKSTVQKCVRKDKQNHINALSESLEEASVKGHMREMF